jgi:hypothetical protein
LEPKAAFWWCWMKRQAKNTGKRPAESTRGRTKLRAFPIEARMPVEKPAFFVDIEAAKQAERWLNTRHEAVSHGVLVVSEKETEATQRTRRIRRQIERKAERATKRVGTFTFWERPQEGMSGMRFIPPTPSKPRRKPDERTLEILEKGAELVGEGRRDWLAALDYWPNIPPKEKRQRYRVLKSKHRELFDSLVEKHKTSK